MTYRPRSGGGDLARQITRFSTAVWPFSPVITMVPSDGKLSRTGRGIFGIILLNPFHKS